MIVREEEERKLEDPEYVSPWRIVKATAHMEDGSLFFPTKLSEKELDRLKTHMGPEYWAAYEGSPVTKDNAIAEAEQIRWKPREEFPALRWCRMFLDPNQHSDAKVLGCYAALVMGGYDMFGKLWVWDARGGRDWDTGRTIDELYRAQEEHPEWPIFVEDEHMRHFDHAVGLEFALRMHEAEKEGGDAPTAPPAPLRPGPARPVEVREVAGGAQAPLPVGGHLSRAGDRPVHQGRDRERADPRHGGPLQGLPRRPLGDGDGRRSEIQG